MYKIKQYDQAFTQFVNEILIGFIRLDGLLGQIQYESTRHRGPSRNVRAPEPLDQTAEILEGTVFLSKEVLRYTKVDEYTNLIFDIVQDHIASLHRSLFNTITQVTTATGNVTHLVGQPLSFDHLNDMLEKTSIEFNDRGEAILPQLVVSPEVAETLKDLKPTEEQIKRRKEIIEQKREEFYAAKRAKRLS